MDLKKDPQELQEITTLSLPISKEYIYIYANTSEVLSFEAKDEFGNNLRVDSDASRFTVYNPGFEVTYELKRPYVVHNNSKILVFMDRMWSEYSIPDIADGDYEFFNVDLFYSVILPEGASPFSASPSDIMLMENSEGRWNISFVDENIQMDAFHDVFETQITFSYFGILDILDDPGSDFLMSKPVSNDTEVLIEIARNEILLFSLLGLIAPLLSFILAYWVFRKRYQKLINRTENLKEENIYVENAHIEALSMATRESEGDITKSFIGHYWRVMRKLSDIMHREISLFNNERLFSELKKYMADYDEALLSQVLSRGQEVSEEDEITLEELIQYAQLVDSVIDELVMH